MPLTKKMMEGGITLTSHSFHMMVGEFMDRPNNSPVNGESGLHAPVGLNSTNAGNGNGNIGNMAGGSPYCLMEPNVDLALIGRDGDDNESGEGSNNLPDNYVQSFELNSHLQRKDLFSQRKQREFIPDNKKDESYWDRRRRNNEAAKRSREKRRYNDMILEQRVVELSKENHFLKAQLTAIKDKYGISGETIVNVEQVMATLPTNDQVLSVTKRAKIANPPLTPPAILYQSNSHPTPVIHRTVPNGSPPLASLHQTYPDAENYNEVDRYPFPHFTPVLPPLHPPALEAAGNSVLNLSRSRGRTSPTPYDLTAIDLPASYNNSLPHKLRHKSHLGDKDVAATALLSLQNIKQEPSSRASSRASPPWDGEGSSDERDSGISLGAEWIISTNNVPDAHPTPSSPLTQHPMENDEDSHLKSEVARLASEVATLKNMLSRKKNTPISIN